MCSWQVAFYPPLIRHSQAPLETAVKIFFRSGKPGKEIMEKFPPSIVSPILFASGVFAVPGGPSKENVLLRKQCQKRTMISASLDLESSQRIPVYIEDSIF